MKLEDSVDDSPYDPTLSFLSQHDEVVQTEFVEWGLDKKSACAACRSRELETASGQSEYVTTVYDLIMAQYGVGRGLEWRLSEPTTPTRTQLTRLRGRKFSPVSIPKQYCSSPGSGPVRPILPRASA